MESDLRVIVRLWAFQALPEFGGEFAAAGAEASRHPGSQPVAVSRSLSSLQEWVSNTAVMLTSRC